MIKSKKTIIGLSLTTIIINVVNLLTLTGSAADITVETYVEGGLTLTLNGDWETGLPQSDVQRISGAPEDITSYWQGNDNEDYITFVDDTETAGFYMEISFSDLTYTGEDVTQTDLPASRIKLFGEYNGTASAGQVGEDDPTKLVSILPDSCVNAIPSNYTLHSDFGDSGKNYALTGSTTSAIVLESSVDCLNLGHVRFDRLETLIESGDAPGSYSSDILLVIYDGSS